MDPKKATSTITGKIVDINYDKRAMLVRGNDEKNPAEYPLKWAPVMDDVCRKEKVGHRVEIETVTDMTQEDPQPYIMLVKFDKNYRKGNQNTYAQSADTGNEILLQSCFRTGAEVLACTWPVLSDDDPDDDGKPVTTESVFNKRMDILMARAIKDAKTIKAEAKKL